MSLDENLSILIKRIYCASADSAEWDRVAHEVLHHTGGCAALTTIVDLTNRAFDRYRFYGPETSNVARGMDEYQFTCVDDPSLAWASNNPRARFCDSSWTKPEHLYLQDPFVKWNRTCFGSTHWYVGYTPPDDQLSFSYSVLFPAEQGPGNSAAHKLFRMLFDHLACAVWLRRRPFNPDSDAAYLLLDSGGNVREVSRGARAVVEANDGLSIVARRLTPAFHAERALLENAIAKVSSVCTTGASTAGVRLSRPSGRRPLLLTIKPLMSNLGPLGAVHCELLVHIHDGRRKVGSLHVARALFELTDREIDVLRLLCEGHSPETLSAHLHISLNTARAHLRALFAKTGTTRQSELLQLMAELALA